MIVLLQPGETLEVRLADSQGHEVDGNLFLRMEQEAFTITTDWPDDQNREKDIYKVTWGH